MGIFREAAQTQVQPVTTIDDEPLVVDLDGTLPLEVHPTQQKLSADARLVGRFQEARPEMPVYLD